MSNEAYLIPSTYLCTSERKPTQFVPYIPVLHIQHDGVDDGIEDNGLNRYNTINEHLVVKRSSIPAWVRTDQREWCAALSWLEVAGVAGEIPLSSRSDVRRGMSLFSRGRRQQAMTLHAT